MYVERHVVTIVTDASGNGTGYTEVLNGKICSINYVKTDYASGVDFAITLEATGETLWTQNDQNASATKYPAAQVNKTDGSAAVAGTDPVLDRIVAGQDRVKIVVSSGGNTKTGTFHVVVA